MIKIENIDSLVDEHYEKIKAKLKEFPKLPKYSLETIIKAKPEKLDEIAKWSKKSTYDFDFMKTKYKNFSTKKQEYNAYDLVKKLNINVCPYCNINTTHTISNKHSEDKIRPELDHFYDKATYPILALSFYNLIPSCHTCNATLKGSEKFSIATHINPYSESFNEMAIFQLSLKNSTFYYSIDGFDLDIKAFDKRAQNQFNTFELYERYNNHKDIILELIQKSEIYNESYLDELLTQYEGILFKNKEDLLRLITCGYLTNNEIGKRPLSKLIKDISTQLGLL